MVARKSIKKILLLCLLLVIVYFIYFVLNTTHFNKSHNIKGIEYCGVAKFYNNKKVALIFRIDDLSLVYQNENDVRWFKDFIKLANSYGIRLVIATITRAPPRPYELVSFDEKDVSFVKNISGYNEIASHTRWHLRAPRKIEDVVGSFVDLVYYVFKGRYRLFTYIYPFGSYDRLDIVYEKIFGVPIGMVLKVKGVLSDPWYWTDSYWRVLPITRKFNYNDVRNINVSNMANQDLNKALKEHGVIIYFTHPTKLNWPNNKTMIRFFTKLFRILEYHKNVIWFTTPRELYSYIELGKKLRVNKVKYADNFVEYRLYYVSEPGYCVFVPLTLIFKIPTDCYIESIVYNNITLLNESSLFYDSSKIHYNVYYIKSRYLYVNVLVNKSSCLKIYYRYNSK